MTTKMKASDFSTEGYAEKPKRLDDKTIAVLVGVPFGYELDQVKMFPQCTIASPPGFLSPTAHTGRGYRLRFRRTGETRVLLRNAIDDSVIELDLDV